MSQVEETVLHRLPDVLQLQLRMSLKQHVVDMIPMFQKLQPLSVLALINRFQSKEAVVGQIIVHQREVADRVYFIVSGRVAVCRSVTAKVLLPIFKRDYCSYFFHSRNSKRSVASGLATNLDLIRILHQVRDIHFVGSIVIFFYRPSPRRTGKSSHIL